ncbi:MAG TPA: PAS domain-containing sensor histidine kinase, partial [Candidatus Hydrogenedentes bacterium]|nr:PAS domain-containing sensor histidine kinase [Candidatus Hydrogenedentota bacterium]
MIQTSVLALAIALQITAGLLSVRLFWREGRRRAWTLVALIFMVIGMRRSLIVLTGLQEGIYAPEQEFTELLTLMVLSGFLLFGVFAMNYSIKSLENTNRALRESEFTFRTMVENLPGAVYRCNADGDRAMLYVSDGIEALTGHPAEEFIHNKTRSFGSIVHEKDLSTWYSRQKSVTDKRPYEIRYRLRHANGNIVCVQDKGRAAFDHKGRLLWLSGFIWDITDTVEAEAKQLSLERQVQHAQKLKSLGVLSGGVAHDFNNLLMAILGHAELAMLVIRPSAPAYENIWQIQRASQRAADLCKQLLAYSGRGAFEIKKIRLHELVTEMLDLLKTSVSKKVALDIKLSNDLPVVSGDPSQLTQVMMNLIINASEAIGDKKGTITVTGSVLSSAEDIPSAAYKSDDMPAGRYVCVRITDTGCGMSEETMGRIFEPFFTTK